MSIYKPMGIPEEYEALYSPDDDDYEDEDERFDDDDYDFYEDD